MKVMNQDINREYSLFVESINNKMGLDVNYSPLIEVGASWSIYLTVQVYPS